MTSSIDSFESTLFYDSLAGAVVSLDLPERSSGSKIFRVPEVKPSWDLIADRDRYFIAGKHRVQVFDSLTEKKVFSVKIEGNLSRFDSFPRGKIAYSRCVSNWRAVATGTSYSQPQNLLVERILVVGNGKHLRVYELPSGEGEKKTLLKLKLGDVSMHNEYTSQLLRATIDSAAFFDKDTVVITVKYGSEEFPDNWRRSYCVIVDINTKVTKVIDPRSAEQKTNRIFPTGHAFAVPGKNLVSFAFDPVNNRTRLVEFKRSATDVRGEDKFELVVLYPDFEWNGDRFWFIASGSVPLDPSGIADTPIGLKVLGFTDGGALITEKGGRPKAPSEAKERKESNRNVCDIEYILPSRVVIMKNQTEKWRLKTLDLDTMREAVFLDLRGKCIALGGELISIQHKEEVPYTITREGKEVPGVPFSRGTNFMVRTEESSSIYSFRVNRVVAYMRNSKITHAIPLRYSSSWKKLMKGKLEEMAPVASALVDVILGFI